MSKTYGEGDALPDFTMDVQVPDDDGRSMSREDFTGRKLVLFFYPRDNTPGCTAEAKDFSALSDKFKAAGTALLGISKDSAKKHHNFIVKHDLKTPLGTDAEEGGLSDELGIWTEKQMYGKTYMGMVRTTYLVDANGKIARVWNKVKVKGHAEDVLDAAQAL
ncbi:MAG: peroxiredoxin [Alteripontixanthobacter sp.]